MLSLQRKELDELKKGIKRGIFIKDGISLSISLMVKQIERRNFIAALEYYHEGNNTKNYNHDCFMDIWFAAFTFHYCLDIQNSVAYPTDTVCMMFKMTNMNKSSLWPKEECDIKSRKRLSDENHLMRELKGKIEQYVNEKTERVERLERIEEIEKVALNKATSCCCVS